LESRQPARHHARAIRGVESLLVIVVVVLVLVVVVAGGSRTQLEAASGVLSVGFSRPAPFSEQILRDDWRGSLRRSSSSPASR